MLGRRLPIALTLVISALGAGVFASVAAADYEYVAGQESFGPLDGVCPGIGIGANAGYYRNEPGRNPRASEPFFLEIKLTYFESFDCAAAFTGITVTLPNGLALDAAGAKRVACQRFNLATGANDARITANCPSSPASLGGTTYSLDPIATNFPERSAFGRKYWFQGSDGTNTYRVMRLLVPVSAAGALSAAPVTFQMKRFDAVNPWNATVNVTTTGAPQPSGGTFTAPQLAVQNQPGEFQISPIGVQVPFSVVKGSGSFGVSEKVVAGTNLANPAYSSCSESATSETAFSADESFLDVFGDFGDPLGVSPACDLKPATQFTLELCVGYRNAANALTASCIPTTFTTPIVDVAVEVADSSTTSGTTTFTPQLRGAWPPGTASLRLTRPGQSETQIASQAVGARGTGTLALNAATLTDLASWQEHTIRGCFTPTAGTLGCGPATKFAPGALAAADPATTSDSATFSAVSLRAPLPALTVQLRVKKAAETSGADPAALPVADQESVSASPGAGTVTAPALVADGLAAATRYAWSVCVELDGDAAPEECTPGAAFTTATAQAQASPTPSPSPSPSPTPAADTTKPRAKLTVKGRLRRRRKVQLIVSATDASGIRSFAIKVGRKKAVARRRLTITLPRRRGKLKIVVTVTDLAGNRTVLTRTLRVR